jgi:hypothetical protein
VKTWEWHMQREGDERPLSEHAPEVIVHDRHRRVRGAAAVRVRFTPARCPR